MNSIEYKLKQIKWAGLRIIFYLYLLFIIFTGILGAIATSPLWSYYLFKDWKKILSHKKFCFPLLKQIYKMLFLVFKEDHNFMFSVPLFIHPRTGPDLNIVKLNPSWESGYSCNGCNHNCCNNCPLIDKNTGNCISYNSFFWKYFNCGRFPQTQSEIDYYKCPKWQVK